VVCGAWATVETANTAIARQAAVAAGREREEDRKTFLLEGMGRFAEQDS